jgi:glycosyltransferase involved in cell wall biosynthesis
MHYERNKLIIAKIPSTKNRLYPQIPLCDPKIAFFRNAFRLLKEHKVKVLIIPDTSETIPILILAKLAGVKHTIYGIHTDIFKIIQSRASWMKYLFMIPLFFHHILASRFADHSSVSSLAFKEQIKNRLAWKFVKIDNTFESNLWSPDFALPLESDREEILRWRFELSKGQVDAPILLYAGRWSAEKRIHLLVNSIPSGWKLALIGDGPDEDCELIEKLAAENPNVYAKRGFLNSKDLSKAYQSADFFVSASDFETFGFSVIESLACGTPVVVQKAGGFLENVKDGQNGALVDFGNAEETKQKFLNLHPKSIAYKNLKRNIFLSCEIPENVPAGYLKRFAVRHSFSLSSLQIPFQFPSFIRRLLYWIYFAVSFISLKTCTWIFA